MKIFNNRDFDKKLFFLWILLMLIGLIAVYSASTLKIEDGYVRSSLYLRQFSFILLSFIVMYIVLKIPTTILDILIFPGFFITLILLIVVFFMPPVNNAYRWINVAGINVQPSELAKIFMILSCAKVIHKVNMPKLQILLKSSVFLLFPFILVIRQPDLGTALVLIVAYVVMLAQAGIPLLIIFILMTPLISIVTSFFIPAFVVFTLGLIYLLYKKKLSIPLISFIIVINLFFMFMTPVLWNTMKPYQQSRILTFIDPSRDPLNTGYQIIQARIAVGSGQLFGKGFLEGTQKNMNFLPEQHTDFIFSVLAEEFGFFGSILLLSVFFFFFVRIVKNIYRSEIRERQIAMAGILGYLFFQVIINIGMNIGLTPTTGITLPFISYGGSSLIVNSLAVALVLKYSMDKDV
jgi:rod shape determining protein RodA